MNITETKVFQARTSQEEGIRFTPEGLVAIMAACGHTITKERAAIAIEEAYAERNSPEDLLIYEAMKKAFEEGKKTYSHIYCGDS
jgi:hypothetical protein